MAFSVIFAFLIIVWFFAICIGVYYLIVKDTHKTRQLIPLIFLATSIIGFVIAIWIIIYIAVIYDHE